MAEPRTKPDYTYRATIKQADWIYDGDTLRASVDLGMGVWMYRQKFRLFGINTPEVRGVEKVEGKKVRAFVRAELAHHIDSGEPIIIQTHKDKGGKYGRWLGTIWYFDTISEEWRNLNTFLVGEGYAKAVDY